MPSKMNNVRAIVRIVRILAVFGWLPYLTAFRIPHTKPAVQTLGSLILTPKHNILNPAQFFVSSRANNSSDEEYSGSNESLDRSYKARKVLHKYPLRYTKKRVKALAKRPVLHPKFYSPYSHWTKCDAFCRQRRERYCTVRSKCGYHIRVEERQCHRHLCSPLTIPVHDEYESIPLHQYSEKAESWKPKKKKKRIIFEEDEEDYYDEEDDAEYVIVKKKSKKPNQSRWKRPHVYGERNFAPNHRHTPDYDDEGEYVSEQRIQNERKPLKIVVDDFDDHKIFSPSPHYQQRFNTAQNFQRRPQTAVFKRKPQRLTEYFEDDYEHLYRDGTGFYNRNDDLVDLSGFPAVHEALTAGAADDQDGANITTSSTEFKRLMESFPTTESTSGASHHTKRDISNFLDDSSEDLDGSQEEDLNSDIDDEGTQDGKKFPGESMLKLGPAVTQKKAREKAVFEMPRKVDNPYSKWSRWSKCTAKCTTRRFKRCKIPSICSNDIIREVAYCYTEGSFCEEWIGNQLYQNNKPQQTPTAAIATTTPKSTKPARSQALQPYQATGRARSDFQDNSIAEQPPANRREFLQPEYMPQELTCGIPSVRGKPKKYLYNMLRIIGGKTSRRGQWPWQVAILNRFKEAFCGGTLVAQRWILTAAHCVRKRLFVRLGEHNLQQSDGTEIEFRIEFSIKHPRYDKKTVDNDVALLRLPRDVERSTYVGYACLPERFQALPTGNTCTIIGWGKKRHSDDAGTDVLHEAEVPIITNDRCRAVYHDYTITKNMFCAGHKRGRVDTCAGDSGGPLLCRDTTKENSPWTIFGITSFGDGCGKKNKFGIYTKLPNYVDWIWSVINCNGNCRT
ncbi:uncharacterized protein LOC134209702 [Armigeres subalbatus]|uniref:uncharacterized protein LOC134209702 n=1 Tax=Armigeres subalbatus TaxID=124917 RepID=UPI002ED00DFC